MKNTRWLSKASCHFPAYNHICSFTGYMATVFMAHVVLMFNMSLFKIQTNNNSSFSWSPSHRSTVHKESPLPIELLHRQLLHSGLRDGLLIDVQGPLWRRESIHLSPLHINVLPQRHPWKRALQNPFLCAIYGLI